MSFLLGALGRLGSSLLGRAVPLLSRAVPFLGKAMGSFGSLFGPSMKTLGKTALSYAVDKGINAAYDGTRRFASSDFIRRKIPFVAPYVDNAADVMRQRLRDGYAELINGERPILDTGGSGGTQNPQFDAVEKQSQTYY